MNGAEPKILQKQKSQARVNWHSTGETKILGWATPTHKQTKRICSVRTGIYYNPVCLPSWLASYVYVDVQVFIFTYELPIKKKKFPSQYNLRTKKPNPI